MSAPSPPRSSSREKYVLRQPTVDNASKTKRTLAPDLAYPLNAADLEDSRESTASGGQLGLRQEEGGRTWEPKTLKSALPSTFVLPCSIRASARLER